jgi:hypothetical protein
MGVRYFYTIWISETVIILLQQGMEHLVSYWPWIFRACLAYGYTPKTWGQVKVMLIAKSKKYDYNEAKIYCPISLFHFLKIMHKLPDSILRTRYSKIFSASKLICLPNWKSALHKVVTDTVKWSWGGGGEKGNSPRGFHWHRGREILTQSLLRQ